MNWVSYWHSLSQWMRVNSSQNFYKLLHHHEISTAKNVSQPLGQSLDASSTSSGRIENLKLCGSSTQSCMQVNCFSSSRKKIWRTTTKHVQMHWLNQPDLSKSTCQATFATIQFGKKSKFGASVSNVSLIWNSMTLSKLKRKSKKTNRKLYRHKTNPQLRVLRKQPAVYSTLWVSAVLVANSKVDFLVTIVQVTKVVLTLKGPLAWRVNLLVQIKVKRLLEPKLRPSKNLKLWKSQKFLLRISYSTRQASSSITLSISSFHLNRQENSWCISAKNTSLIKAERIYSYQNLNQFRKMLAMPLPIKTLSRFRLSERGSAR